MTKQIRMTKSMQQKSTFVSYTRNSVFNCIFFCMGVFPPKIKLCINFSFFNTYILHYFFWVPLLLYFIYFTFFYFIFCVCSYYLVLCSLFSFFIYYNFSPSFSLSLVHVFSIPFLSRLPMSWTAEGLVSKFRWGQNFSPLHSVQTGPMSHPAFNSKGTGFTFSGGNAAGAWSRPLTSNWCRVQEWWRYTSTPPHVFMA
jgi:hypothetical protein